MSDETLPVSRKSRRAGLVALLLTLPALVLWLLAAMVHDPEDRRETEGFPWIIALLAFASLVVSVGFLVSQAKCELDRSGWKKRDYLWLAAAIGMIVLVVAGLLVGVALTVTRPAADRMLNGHKLRQLGVAMHEYHDKHTHLPAHAIYKDGKPLLSWRVAILPYLGEKALYDEFHLDEPWYSEHNLTLLPRMPKVFKRPSSHHGGDTMTHYQVLVGPGAIFEGAKPRTLGEIAWADGTANTILIADALEPVPWTKPDDLPFDPNGPPPPFRYTPIGVMVAFADCSTREVRKPVDESQLRVLRAIITWNGGEKEVTGVLD